MGHASMQTTERFYLHRSDANELKACLAFDRLMAENTTDARTTPEGTFDASATQGENLNSLSSHRLPNCRNTT